MVDFLVEALDEYEFARTTGNTREGEAWDGPNHAVRVPVLAGASAGGMTAAMAAFQLFRHFEHVRPGAPAPKPDRNRLYANWVEDIDIAPLLATTDLRGGAGLRSVLCCTVLDEIVQRTVEQDASIDRAWVGQGASNGLAVILTVSNIGGVPYEFTISGATPDGAYGMLNHGDDMRFLVGRAPLSLPQHAGFDIIDLKSADAAAKGRLGAAALATGAFPIGLAARPLQRPFSDYSRPDRVGFDQVMPNGELRFVPVPPKTEPHPYPDHRFVAVDGGVIDNEPFELARRFLSDQAEPNPDNRNGIKTSYAVLLVDPFPNRAGWPPEGGSDLLSDLIGPLISTLVDQARFKPQELALALNDSVCSRFAILPEPMLDTDKARKLPIACGALGGFSGFLEHSFRRHDYLLGKRNAQAFLRWHLHLPKSNPLFTPWESRGGNLEAWYVREVTERPERSIAPGADLAQRWKLVPKTVQDPDKPRPETEPALPIIPLTRRLQEPIVIGPEDWPRPERVDIRRLEDELSARFSSVVQILVDRDLREYVPAGPVGRFALKQFLPGVLTRRAVRAISMAKDEITAAFQG